MLCRAWQLNQIKMVIGSTNIAQLSLNIYSKRSDSLAVILKQVFNKLQDLTWKVTPLLVTTVFIINLSICQVQRLK